MALAALDAPYGSHMPGISEQGDIRILKKRSDEEPFREKSEW